MSAAQQPAKPQTQANGAGNLGQICTSSWMQFVLFHSFLLKLFQKIRYYGKTCLLMNQTVEEAK